MANDLFLSLFFVFRHHLRIIQTPKIFVKYHQVLLLLFFVLLGILGAP